MRHGPAPRLAPIYSKCRASDRNPLIGLKGDGARRAFRPIPAGRAARCCRPGGKAAGRGGTTTGN
jgi:hypothetical protein